MVSRRREFIGRGYSILFVDDEEMARHYFTRLCEAEFDVITTEGASHALEILKKDHDKFAVLLTDQKMPKLSGTELLTITQKLYPNIVRLLTTAYMARDETVDLVIQGEILSKPWRAENLRTTLLSAMQLFLEQKQTLRHP